MGHKASQQIGGPACFRRDQQGWSRDELDEIGFDNLGAGWIRFFRLEIISFDTFGVHWT
jgi:hypothetical protein